MQNVCMRRQIWRSDTEAREVEETLVASEARLCGAIDMTGSL